MPVYEAFLSYAHFDNYDGRVSKFREELEKRLSQGLGREFTIFQDTTGLAVGSLWEQEIAKALDSSVVLIALITPSFFNREWCRREVETFLSLKPQQGRPAIIIPIYWLETPLLDDPVALKDHPIGPLLSAIQYDDWTNVFDEPIDSPEVRKKLSVLTKAILTQLKENKSSVISPSSTEVAQPILVAQPTPTIVDISKELEALSEIVRVAEDNLRYLKQLVRAAQENRLVPFVGAGMSQPVGLKLWPEAMEAIYQQAKPSLTVDTAVAFGSARATGRLEEAAQVLWEAMKDKWFNDRIHALFGQDTLSTEKIKTAPVSLLPKIANGPVLTTNFDAVLEQVYGDFTEVTLGDYRADKILDDWDDKKHFLLKLHGDADENYGRVLTRDQYDRAYDERQSRLPDLLRQLFSSRRPLLFLGCSLDMDRTVTELQKAGMHLHNASHFALLKDPGEATRNRRQNELVGELGIQPIWFRDFNDIRLILEFLVRVRGNTP